MFSKGEVVWAKLKGFPWWPAIVSKISDNKSKKDSKAPSLAQPNEVTVNFLGENSHATLPEAKIEKFEKSFKEFSSDIKKKKLLDAIDLAKKLYEQSNPPITPTKQAVDKNLKLKRKPLSKESEIENEECKESEDLIKVEDEIIKKVKTENPSSYERVTRSKAVVTKKDDFGEKSIDNREGAMLIEPNNQFNDNKDLKEEINEEELKQSQEKKLNYNNKIIENNIMVAANQKNNVSSSLALSHTQTKKIEDLPTTKKKNQLPNLNKKKMDEPLGFPRSKFVKRALVSSKRKNNINNHKKSVSERLEKDENDLIKNLEKRLKYGIEIIIKEDLYDKNYPEIVKTINECVNDIARLFVNSNSKSLSVFLSKNIGKEMALLEKLCEENKNLLKNLFNIEYYIKELKKTNNKIESEVYSQFFDCFSLLNELNIPYAENNLDKKNSSFFSNTLIFSSKNKYDPYHTPTRNSNPLNFSNGQSSFEENEPHHSEISSNNPLNNEDLDLKNLGKIESFNDKNHLPIENKLLRKRICHKMSKILQEKNGMDKQKSQDVTLQIELKIRNLHPDMKGDYKEKIKILLKLMKDCKMDVDRYLMGEEINFESLKIIESTPQNKYDDDNISNDRFDTPIPHKLSQFDIKSQ